MAVLLAGLTLAPRAVQATDWPSFGLDPGRARFSPERSGNAFAPAWTHQLPAGDEAIARRLLGSPVAADGVVVFGTAQQEVRALRELDGQLLWTFRAPGPVLAAPALDRGRVFVASVNGTVCALALADGALLWQQDLGSLIFASPVIAEGSLFLATGNSNPRVLRLGLGDGKVVWQSAPGLLEQAALAPLAIGGGRVVVGQMGGTYRAFAVADGALAWTARVPGTVNLSAPLVLGGAVLVYPGGAEARLHALQLASGQPILGFPLAIPDPAPEPFPGRRLGGERVASSLGRSGDQVVFTRRLDERFDDNNDGLVDRFLAREDVVFVAVDVDADGALRGTPAVTALVPNGRRVAGRLHEMPTHGLGPTPAGFATSAGAAVAVGSSLDATLRVLTATGGVAWNGMLSGASRASPSFANGHLVVATDAGEVQGFASAANRAPTAPWLGLAPAGGKAVEVSSLVLRWGAAPDPDDGLPRYLVRVDDDGELLRDWDVELFAEAGVQTAALANQLPPGRAYVFAVRAQDAHGAWSAWSYPASFRVVASGSVHIGETMVGSLAEALARAQPGDVIKLGAGTFPLAETAKLPGGVTLEGVGPHLTTLDATGLGVGVSPGTGSTLRQLRVAGAMVGVEITDAREVSLRNVILSDNTTAGLAVEISGSATLVNGTVARNGIGVRADGTTAIRNSLVTDNQSGITARDPALCESRYNDVFGNRTNWQGAAAHATDLDQAAAFEAGDDFRLQPAQRSTDQGHPDDAWSLEPAPNGGRINIGAFGNTRFAELSAADIPSPSPPPPPPDGGAGPDGGPTADAATADGGTASVDPGACACDVGAARRPAALPFGLLLAGALLARLRRRRR